MSSQHQEQISTGKSQFQAKRPNSTLKRFGAAMNNQNNAIERLSNNPKVHQRDMFFNP